MPGAAPPEIDGGPGAQVFANNGCGGCHTLAAANRAASPDRPRRSPARPERGDIVKEAIVNPNEMIAQGYPAA